MTELRNQTIERLLSAIRQSGEFPAMAKTVGLIGSLTSSEATSSATLADTILQDYGLTQKVLRLVNTAVYAQYDEVTTITRAVLLMGFERIRSIATGLILFEQFEKRSSTPVLADALNMAFYSAILGRNIADASGFTDPEETFIAALFHRLGQLLVAFYLPGDYEAIQEAGDGTADARALAVLGVGFEEIGVEVANQLSIPQRLTESMVRVPAPEAKRQLAPGERLGCLATFANGITDLLAVSQDPQKKRAGIERLAASYRSQIPIPGKLDDLIVKAVKELRESSSTFRLELRDSRFLSGVGEWRAAAAVSSPGVATPTLADASSAGALVSDVADAEGAASGDQPETVLTKGLHEITTLLIGEYSLDDVLKVVLETVYRALGPGRTRVFFLLKDPSAPVARYRFGFGHTAIELKPWFQVPIRGAEDLISLAFTHQKDIVIKDATVAEIVRALPDWFTARGALARYMILLPLVVDQKSVGLFYVDGDKPDAAVLTPAVINYLKVLRGQAVLAIRQKASRPAGRR